MCLGIPGQVVSMVDGYHDQLAVVEVNGGQQRVNVGMLDGQHLEPGQWVVVHMGFAMEVIPGGEAEEILRGLETTTDERTALATPAQPVPASTDSLAP